MIKKHFIETVLSNDEIAYKTGLLKISCTDHFLKLFRPGQFAHIMIPHAEESLLRRPISINYVDYENNEVHLVYGVVGKGTLALTKLKPGDSLDVLMPLGNGFHITSSMKKIWLIGGGIGVAPLKSVVSKYKDRDYSAFLGFRSKQFAYQILDFQCFSSFCSINTDDGTFGEKGFCTDSLALKLKKEQPDVILACGPPMFFKSLAKVAGDVPVQVSMEQKMGCGTGGCSTCVCKIGEDYKRVCVEGPVFDSKEVKDLYV